jgi:dTDP-4-amino-4,6-dideoxygalactose transaminase
VAGIERSTAMVLLNDFRRQWVEIGQEVLAAVGRVGASGWYILGEYVKSFEHQLARSWPASEAVGVGSGLDALEIGLRCLRVGPADKVLTTPLSAFATTLAILRTGAVPVFVDVDGSGLIDLDRCRALLHRETTIRCLLPVHLYGHALDLDALEGLMAEFDLQIVEDCAQSIGATSQGRSTGSVGQVAATSFYPTKNLGALGDGGAVLTASPTIAQQARALRHYGQSATYAHDHVGLNSRLDELHAAVLCEALLPHLAEWTERRRRNVARMRQGIANAAIELPPVPAGSISCWHLFPVLVSPADRDAFVEHLRLCGIQSAVHYPRLIPAQRALADYGRFEVAGELNNARRFALGEVSLPIHPVLTEEEICRIVESCNAWKPS